MIVCLFLSEYYFNQILYWFLVIKSSAYLEISLCPYYLILSPAPCWVTTANSLFFVLLDQVCVCICMTVSIDWLLYNVFVYSADTSVSACLSYNVIILLIDLRCSVQDVKRKIILKHIQLYWYIQEVNLIQYSKVECWYISSPKFYLYLKYSGNWCKGAYFPTVLRLIVPLLSCTFLQ